MSILSIGSSAILGTSLVAASFLFSWSPAAAPATSVGPKKWPPPPTDQVNVALSLQAIQVNAPVTVYTVPAGRWLVVTRLLAGNEFYQVKEKQQSTSTVKAELFEPILGANLLWPLYSSVRPGLGLVFSPGSEVQVVPSVTQANNNFFVRLDGYLTK
ncbi:MAG: hypothetical protein JNJ88_09895 [Planctomycetes bacterium]|nr:hypothetical protein [Planctomycetota bacterium]